MGCGASSAPETNAGSRHSEDLTYWPEQEPQLSRDISAEERLRKLLENRPYLESPEHYLNSFVLGCRAATEKASSATAEDAAAAALAAHDALDHLALELASEERMAFGAFARFDKNRNHYLQGIEIEYMLDYLGFPHQQEDVDKFVSAVDRLEPDGKISPEEFLKTVGNLGGCCKLFAMRRQQIEARGTELEVTESMKESDLRCQLLSCGMLDDEQSTWKPVVSAQDLVTAANLEPCQMDALRHVRNLARINHNKALPELTQRFEQMGYTVADMWMTLAWIRELAPVIIHVNLPTIAENLAKDSHYRNQFETKSSAGLLDFSVRNDWEASLFGRAYEDAQHFHRPKYGVLNVWNDPYGIYGCEQYGDSYLVLKDVRLRCTLAPQDSGGLPAQRLAVLDYYGHTLLEYSREELEETVKLARHGREKLGDSQHLCHDWGKYKEVQIHGEIDLSKHVERIVINERHIARKAQYEEMAQNKGWQIAWVKEMVEELKAKSFGKELSRQEFDSLLEKIDKKEETTSAPTTSQIPEEPAADGATNSPEEAAEPPAGADSEAAAAA